MRVAAISLCEEIQGCKVAYIQSDEISLLLTDYDELNTDAWFDNNLQKMVSISASIATLNFNLGFNEFIDLHEQCIDQYSPVEELESLKKRIANYKKVTNTALFDSRAFNIPKEEVNNYFLWRQQDATRNSILSLGQYHFSRKELHGKSCNKIQEMLFSEKGINFNDIPTYNKRGSCIVKRNPFSDSEGKGWVIDFDIPIFSQDVNYIERYI